jgi:hypothetical protein
MKENIPFSVEGYKGGSTRKAKEANEGIVFGTGLVLSSTNIEVLDLICEGPIEGLVTGEYSYSGDIGDIGWSRVSFNANTPAQGEDSSVKWLQSIYWNEVPLASKNGQFNFQDIQVQQTKGSPNGSNVSDQIVDEIKVSRNIQERLRGGGEEFAKYYRVTNRYCKSVELNVRIDVLSKTNSKNGDIEVTDVSWATYYKPVFNNRQQNDYTLGKSENVRGKLTSPYIRSSRIDMPDNSDDVNFIGWDIKVVRYTEDPTTSALRNRTTIDSLTEIYGDKLIYPNSAIVASVFDAEYHSSLPVRQYLTRLLKVQIPSNYEPLSKTYNETTSWDGTFKDDKYWTDNPAWCFYDLLTNKRYGLGNYIPVEYIDKFSLYEISKYCDTLVPDGYGGIEPRFSCNVYISSREDAYKVINEMASIFRGITYYSAGQIYTSQDKEKPFITAFTNANVENGDFTYSSSAKKARHTVALVQFNNKKNFYKPEIEYVEDIDGIRQFGIREIEVPAFGATSRGQALRMGRWALLTERLETETVSFTAGLEASYLRPGDIIKIYDQYKNGDRFGGRVSDIVCSPTTTNVTLDSTVNLLDGVDYNFSIVTPSYFYDTSLVSDLNQGDETNIRRVQVQSIPFNKTQLSTVDSKSYLSIPSPLDVVNYNVSGNNVWIIEPSNNLSNYVMSGKSEYYRILQIGESEKHKYTIEALEYAVDKFNMIDSGFNFETVATNAYTIPGSPTKLELKSKPLTKNSSIITYSFSTPDITNVSTWRMYAKKSPFVPGDELLNDYVFDELPLKTNTGLYVPSTNGTYHFQVFGVSSNNILSTSSAYNSISISNVNPVADVLISSLRLVDDEISTLSGYNEPGTSLTGKFYTDSPEFTWQAGLNGYNLPIDLMYRISMRPPSPTNIPSKEIYYQETGYKTSLANLTYTFDFNKNFGATSTLLNKGPWRKFDIVVEAMDSDGYSSAGGNFLTSDKKDSDFSNAYGYDIFEAYNPKPAARCLTDAMSNVCPDGDYKSKQWITADGEIKLFFTYKNDVVTVDDWFDDDIDGLTVYYSDYPFTALDVKKEKANISSMQVTVDNNPVIVPANVTNRYLQYIAVAPYDSFDAAFGNYFNNYLVTGLDISNTVTGWSTAYDFGAYRAWGEFEIGLKSGPDITYIKQKSFNLATATLDDLEERKNLGDQPAILNLSFQLPLITNKYVVMVNGSPQVYLDEDSKASHTLYRDNASFQIKVTQDILSSNAGGYHTNLDYKSNKATFFVGVLSNTY